MTQPLGRGTQEGGTSPTEGGGEELFWEMKLGKNRADTSYAGDDTEILEPRVLVAASGTMHTQGHTHTLQTATQ